MVKFVNQWATHDYPDVLSNHVKQKVQEAPDHYSGALEAVEQKLNVLIGLVSAMADSLSVPAQRRLAASLSLQEAEEPPEFPLPVRVKE